MSTVTTGKTAPPFDLTGTDGGPYSLQAGLRQGPVLAVFFKVSCPTCQYTFPFVERLYQQLREKGAQVWGIAQDNARDTASFAKQYDITFPILIDDEPYSTSQDYGITRVPTLFLIAPDGRVEISGDGFCKADLVAIHKALASHLSASPPPLFRPDEKIPEFKPG